MGRGCGCQLHFPFILICTSSIYVSVPSRLLLSPHQPVWYCDDRSDQKNTSRNYKQNVVFLAKKSILWKVPQMVVDMRVDPCQTGVLIVRIWKLSTKTTCTVSGIFLILFALDQLPCRADKSGSVLLQFLGHKT